MIKTQSSHLDLVVAPVKPQEVVLTRGYPIATSQVTIGATQRPLQQTLIGTTEWNAQLTQMLSDAANGIDAVLVTQAINHASARIKTFKAYDQDWDGEGASAPCPDLLDAALLFLGQLQPWIPIPLATLDSQGEPVIEFRDPDNSLFGKVRFVSPGQIEMFAVSGSEKDYFEGELGSEEVSRFLSNHLQITLRQS